MQADLRSFLPKSMKSLVRSTRANLDIKLDFSKFGRLYRKYRNHTMIPKPLYVENLRVAEMTLPLDGDVVECGTWRGGMAAGVAEVLGTSKKYFLFDSFEGLPPAKEVDGHEAIAWQNDTQSSNYFDNCAADVSYAATAMAMAGVNYECIKGWFENTVPGNTLVKISLLRLDGDWYESTMTCLVHLYPKVVKGGYVIIDDYAVWDGCSRAVHDFLSSIKSKSRIHCGPRGVAYIIKLDD